MIDWLQTFSRRLSMFFAGVWLIVTVLGERCEA